MAFASVTVSKPKNRLIYLGGDYQNSAGNSSTDTFTVPSGGNVAETLNARRQGRFPQGVPGWERGHIGDHRTRSGRASGTGLRGEPSVWPVRAQSCAVSA